MLLPQWMQWIWLAITLAALTLGGYLLMKLLRLEMRAIARKATRERELDAALLAWIEDLARGIRPAVVILVLILGVFATLRALGHPAAVGWRPAALLDWLLTRGVRITLLVACSYLVLRIVHMLVSKASLLIRPHDATTAAEIERQKRVQTITIILRRFSSVVIVVVTGLMLLTELGVSITPILTGLGVVGVALGFGAQQLVGDLIAGFFHIFENQIRVGDVAVINGTAGQVEEIRLRTTVLRGLDGTVHVFRNGTISTLSNMTKDFSYFAMDLAVSYKEDTDRVSQLLREVAADLQKDPQFAAAVLEPVEILGVESFSETAVIIKMRLKTLPSKQWEVGREFRRRLKRRFEQEGVELPVPTLLTLAPAGRPSSAQANPPAAKSE